MHNTIVIVMLATSGALAGPVGEIVLETDTFSLQVSIMPAGRRSRPPPPTIISLSL